MNNVRLNGKPLPLGCNIQFDRDVLSGRERYALIDPLGSFTELDPSKHWIEYNGQVVWGTPPSQETSPAPPPPTPDRVKGKVLGFRCWSFDGYRLKSANQAIGASWTIGENKAECLIDRWHAYSLVYPNASQARQLPASTRHVAPAPNCECRTRSSAASIRRAPAGTCTGIGC